MDKNEVFLDLRSGLNSLCDRISRENGHRDLVEHDRLQLMDRLNRVEYDLQSSQLDLERVQKKSREQEVTIEQLVVLNRDREFEAMRLEQKVAAQDVDLQELTPKLAQARAESEARLTSLVRFESDFRDLQAAYDLKTLALQKALRRTGVLKVHCNNLEDACVHGPGAVQEDYQPGDTNGPVAQAFPEELESQERIRSWRDPTDPGSAHSGPHQHQPVVPLEYSILGASGEFSWLTERSLRAGETDSASGYRQLAGKDECSLAEAKKMSGWRERADQLHYPGTRSQVLSMGNCHNLKGRIAVTTPALLPA